MLEHIPRFVPHITWAAMVLWALYAAVALALAWKGVEGNGPVWVDTSAHLLTLPVACVAAVALFQLGFITYGQSIGWLIAFAVLMLVMLVAAWRVFISLFKFVLGAVAIIIQSLLAFVCGVTWVIESLVT